MPIAFVAIHVLNFATHPALRHPTSSARSSRSTRRTGTTRGRATRASWFLRRSSRGDRASQGAGDGSRRWMATAIGVDRAARLYVCLLLEALGAALAAWMVVLLLRVSGIEARRLLLVGGMAALIALPELLVVVWRAVTAATSVIARLDPFGIDTSLAATIGHGCSSRYHFCSRCCASVAQQLYVALFMTPLRTLAVAGVVPQQLHYQTQCGCVRDSGSSLAERRSHRGFAWGGAARGVCGPRRDCLAHCLRRGVAGRHPANCDGSSYRTRERRVRRMRAHLSDRDTVVSPSISTNLLLASLTPSGSTWRRRVQLRRRLGADRTIPARQAADGFSS